MARRGFGCDGQNINSIAIFVVDAGRKLVHAAHGTFGREMMERSEVSAPQEYPERFHAVGVNISAHTLAFRMIHALMLIAFETIIQLMVVGVNYGALSDIFRDLDCALIMRILP